GEGSTAAAAAVAENDCPLPEECNRCLKVLAGALNADLIQGGIDEDEIVGNLVIDTRHNNSCGNDHNPKKKT
ncbi:hypothetical protein ACHAXH_000410, partial [Discostella pseudostelligera]